jgi:site-specific recombinase XerD
MVRGDERDFEVQLALGGFLTGYSGNTRLAYQQDLRLYVGWCHQQGIGLLDVRRTHIELFARWLEHNDEAGTTIARRLSTVAGFYRYCVEEELLAHSPASNVCRPWLRHEATIRGLDRNELGAFLVQAGLSGARDHALACLLALNGLRVSEALGTNIADVGLERGHHTLRVRRKGGKTVIVPMARRTARSVYLVIGERSEGPIFTTVDGARMNRHQATRMVQRLTEHAGIDKKSPPTRYATASSPPPSTREYHSATSKKPPPTPTPGPRCDTTGHADHSTDTPPTSWPPSSPEPADEVAHMCRYGRGWTACHWPGHPSHSAQIISAGSPRI